MHKNDMGEVLTGARSRLVMVHKHSARQDACRGTKIDDAEVNALKQLVQDWIDAEPGRSILDLARRADMSRNTIYAAIKDGAGMPRKATMEKLARGLEVPVATVRDAAAAAAGYRVEPLDSDSQEIQAFIALLGELPEQRRKELWEIGRMYLRRNQEAP